MAWKRKIKLLARILIAVALVMTIGIAVALHVMGLRDKEHARFLETGKSINKFLSDYGHAIKDSFEQKNAAAVIHFYSESYSAPSRGRSVMQQGNDESGVSVLRVVSEGQETYNRESIADEVSAYLNTLASIQNIWCKIDLIEAVEPERRVTLRVKFILDGTNPQGAIFQDRHFYRWQLVNEAAPGAGYDWKIVKDEMIEGVRVAGDGHGFVELDPTSIGINYKHERDPKLNAELYGGQLKFDVMEHAFGGVSAVDYNNDDLTDIFFADGVRSRLFKNVSATGSGEVRFVDVTQEAGLDGIDQANAGLFADVDNDGFQDLFVARYLAPNKFFHNNGDGTFTDRSQEMGLDALTTSMVACFLDYDRDGYLDLYVGTYGDAFESIPRTPFFAENALPNRLYHNEGGRGFKDVTEASGTGYTGWTLAVAAGDYDADGFPDIAVASDMGRKCLYHNNGDGTFTDEAKRAGVLDFSAGMGVAFGDLNDDGRLDLYTSNINSNQRWFGEDQTVSQYMRNVMRSRWLVLDAYEYWKFYRLVGSDWSGIGKMVGEGNSLFQNNGDRTFRELKDSHTNRAGWAWGIALFDADNDTDLDIYVANGWISNKSKDDL
ncbi:MAG: enediyne biosynthesis protein [Acidobacteriota bacterium]|jgi:hypothetical protein|nr:enediyne biosynthesis protein [Acidobacteriota bacterium]